MRIPLDEAALPSEGQGKPLLLPDGREVALFRRDGVLYAIENSCAHEGGPLGEGELAGYTVTCPWHGWQYDIRTGKCDNFWDAKVDHYPIESQDGHWFLVMPDR